MVRILDNHMCARTFVDQGALDAAGVVHSVFARVRDRRARWGPSIDPLSKGPFSDRRAARRRFPASGRAYMRADASIASCGKHFASPVAAPTPSNSNAELL